MQRPDWMRMTRRLGILAILAIALPLGGCIDVKVAQPPTQPSLAAEGYTGPRVDFTWKPDSPRAGEAVRFTPQVRVLSNTTASSWLWTWGDGEDDARPAPAYIYVQPGLYTVRLRVVASDGRVGQVEHVVTVVAKGAGSATSGALASTSATSPLAPPAITVQTTSLGLRFSYTWSQTVAQQAWDFGDGLTSNEFAPVHQYRVPGNYGVTLSVLSDSGQLGKAAATAEVLDAPISFATFSTGGTGGEPSIGVLSDGTVFTAVNPEALRSRDAGQTWDQVSDLLSAPLGFDPYLWVDATTDRVFHLNLYIGCSYLSYSDDGGDSWTTNPLACGTPVNDHQKLATGPFRAPLTPTVYPNAVYYASNQVLGSSFSVSLDGGLSWIPGVVGTPGLCGSGGTNGQPHGSPTGMVYLPFYNCDSTYVARSENNGLSFTPVVVDGSVGTGKWDPDLDTDLAGTTYIALQSADFQSYIAFTKDDGRTWSKLQRVSPPEAGMTMFPTIVAGGQGRVAVSYIATSNSAATADDLPPDTQWFLYTSLLEGADTATPTLATFQITPEPIQIGELCTGGLGCDTPGGNGDKRNLLEFIDSRLDPTTGRLWITYTDGCDGCTSTGDSTKSVNKVARLDVGPSLLDGARLVPP